MRVRDTAVSGKRLRAVIALAAVIASLLAGCVNPPGAATDQTKDIVTASDETPTYKRAKVRMELAGAYFGRGQMTTALDEVKLALVAEPNLPEAFNLRGLIYGELGQEKLAEESFRRALQLAPRDADAMHNFGWFLCQQRRFPEADGMFLQAQAQPQYRGVTRTLLAQGVCQARAGSWEQAEATLTRSFELDPTNPSAAVNLAEVLYNRGDFERARYYVRRVNATPGVSNAQTLWLATRIEQKLGNRAGTEQLGRQLQDRFPQSRESAAYVGGKFDD
ncbi:MAG: pilF [Rhizobacter sp.]|nr:pilF [Rhizobacter sp.]